MARVDIALRRLDDIKALFRETPPAFIFCSSCSDNQVWSSMACAMPLDESGESKQMESKSAIRKISHKNVVMIEMALSHGFLRSKARFHIDSLW